LPPHIAALMRYLLERPNPLICPVQPHFQKHFRFHLTQIISTTLAIPPPRGAYRDRHGRGEGCGGRGSVGRAIVVMGRVSRE
jgi:hypothetical protein